MALTALFFFDDALDAALDVALDDALDAALDVAFDFDLEEVGFDFLDLDWECNGVVSTISEHAFNAFLKMFGALQSVKFSRITIASAGHVSEHSRHDSPHST